MVSTPLKNMKVNGKDYPIYYGKLIQMFETTNQIKRNRGWLYMEYSQLDFHELNNYGLLEVSCEPIVHQNKQWSCIRWIKQLWLIHSLNNNGWINHENHGSSIGWTKSPKEDDPRKNLTDIWYFRTLHPDWTALNGLYDILWRFYG